MFDTVRHRAQSGMLLTASVTAATLAAAAYFGRHASWRVLALLTAGLVGLTLLLRPVLGLLALVVAALALPLEFGTGTAVTLNPATLLVPALLALWLLDMVRRREVRLAPSGVNRPLFLFLLASLFSLLIGRVAWDPLVPVKSNFWLVQLAQWAILAFSAGAFWLTANLIRDEVWLRRLTVAFLLLAGSVAVLRAVPGLSKWTDHWTTIAFIRAPLWALLAGLAGGQLLFNDKPGLPWRLFLVAVLASVLVYAFVEQREAASNWVGIGAVAGVLVWLRFPRLRWPLVAAVLVMAATGILLPAVYNFAGGDAEWRLSGGSRLALIRRVIEVTLRNPITGLGPAAYRPYAATKPLPYQSAYWIAPQVNSHNNYVDLFAHVGLLGLGLFLWFVAELAFLGRRLHNRFRAGFAAGFVNGMLAVGVGALVLMLLADWILPFVYNIGFPGFQASVLVWLFMGGLVALENMSERPD